MAEPLQVIQKGSTMILPEVVSEAAVVYHVPNRRIAPACFTSSKICMTHCLQHQLLPSSCTTTIKLAFRGQRFRLQFKFLKENPSFIIVNRDHDRVC